MFPVSRLLSPVPSTPPTPDSRLPIPDSLARLGDFRILREIGCGGMGVVYEAEQLSLGRHVALKVLPFASLLDERTLARFRTEARAAASLTHPHIVAVYASGQDRGVFYYAMQLIHGCTLADWIARLREGEAPAEPSAPNPPNPKSEIRNPQSPAHNPKFKIENPKSASHFHHVAEIGLQIAEALSYAHDQGIIHRDIKPSNLLLDQRGIAWITDFGLAAVDDVAQLTTTGDLLGTLRYMSPEQAAGECDTVDHRTDIYSFGITLYELITLQPAFRHTQRAALLHQVLHETPPPPGRLVRHLPRDLESIILKATAKHPADRYSTAAELADDLRRFLAAKPIHARRPGYLVAARQLATSRIVRIAAGLTAAIAACAFLLSTPYSVLSTAATSHPSRNAKPPTAQSATRNLQSAIDANPKSQIENPKSALPILAPPGLIAWWSGDGHANDLVGTHHGQLMSGTTFAPGLVGQAFSLDGIDDFVRIPHDSTLNPDAGFTIECWIRSASTAGPHVFVSKWNDNTGDWSYLFKDSNFSDKLQLQLSETSQTDLAFFMGRTGIVTGEWMHVAATYDNKTAKLYLNGSPDASQTTSNARFIHKSAADLLIGANQIRGRVSEHFSGLIDELSLYNRALTEAEVQSIFAAGPAGKLKHSEPSSEPDRVGAPLD